MGRGVATHSIARGNGAVGVVTHSIAGAADCCSTESNLTLPIQLYSTRLPFVPRTTNVMATTVVPTSQHKCE